MALDLTKNKSPQSLKDWKELEGMLKTGQVKWKDLSKELRDGLTEALKPEVEARFLAARKLHGKGEND